MNILSQIILQQTVFHFTYISYTNFALKLIIIVDQFVQHDDEQVNHAAQDVCAWLFES